MQEDGPGRTGGFGCPSDAARDRLADALHHEVAELRLRMSETALRSDALRQAGHPDAAAEVVAEQRELLRGFNRRVEAAVAAAAVEREAEEVVAVEARRAAEEARPASRQPTAAVVAAMVSVILLAIGWVSDGLDLPVLRSGHGSTPTGDEDVGTRPSEDVGNSHGHVAVAPGLDPAVDPGNLSMVLLASGPYLPTASNGPDDVPTPSRGTLDHLVEDLTAQLDSNRRLVGDRLASIVAVLESSGPSQTPDTGTETDATSGVTDESTTEAEQPAEEQEGSTDGETAPPDEDDGSAGDDTATEDRRVATETDAPAEAAIPSVELGQSVQEAPLSPPANAI